MGKGSAPRPFSVANEEYASRWDAIFGKDKKKEEQWGTSSMEKPEVVAEQKEATRKLREMLDEQEKK